MSDRPMPQTPLVDVVLCTHRVGEYLEEALDSLLHQTWPRWRLTLVDDGSKEPDRLDRMVDRITDSQVIHQRWLGQAAARNHAIRNSCGDLITFLDDDDVWHPERLERL